LKLVAEHTDHQDLAYFIGDEDIPMEQQTDLGLAVAIGVGTLPHFRPTYAETEFALLEWRRRYPEQMLLEKSYRTWWVRHTHWLAHANGYGECAGMNYFAWEWWHNRKVLELYGGDTEKAKAAVGLL